MALSLMLLLGTMSVAIAAPVATPPAPRLAEPQAKSLANEVAEVGTALVATGQVPALAIAMVTSDEILLAEAFGETAVGSGTGADSQTVFRLASVSKTFTAALLSVLVEERYLRWSTPLADYLPQIRFQDPKLGETLTLEQLLSHRTGLPHHTFDLRIEANEELHTLVDELYTVTPKCVPGDCYAYQNVAFTLAGVLAEAATGDFLDVLMARRLFVPLQMTDASVGREALLSAGSWSRPHVRRGGRWRAVEPLPTYYRLPAAAGVNASATDLAKWMQALLGARPEVLSDRARTQMAQTRIDTPTEIRGTGWRRKRLSQAGYGLGVRVFEYSGQQLVFHAGAVQGYRALLGVLPDSDFGVAIVWNSESGLPAGLFPTILDRWLSLPPERWLDGKRFGHTALLQSSAPTTPRSSR
ncbi:MAG: beta-lactamase family protein [Xanthomonadales bacterium]|nr:beta-lactamase family protein [Xanthomonadales bacterium]